MSKRPVHQQRRVPQRTCVGCRCSTAKRELIRIVRTPEGPVEVDVTGKRPGRGAYLCSRVECWLEALKKDRLSSALRIRLSEEDKERLRAHAESMRATSTM
jgi:predicted RNA-binding protein YlxR (DUF448 family)